MHVDIDLRKDLFGNIYLSSGTTMLPGFAQRVQKEVTMNSQAYMKVNIVARPERKYMVWLGGAILSSLSSFEKLWITKADYEESGPNIVHLKCL